MMTILKVLILICSATPLFAQFTFEGAKKPNPNPSSQGNIDERLGLVSSQLGVNPVPSQGQYGGGRPNNQNQGNRHNQNQNQGYRPNQNQNQGNRPNQNQNQGGYRPTNQNQNNQNLACPYGSCCCVAQHQCKSQPDGGSHHGEGLIDIRIVTPGGNSGSQCTSVCGYNKVCCCVGQRPTPEIPNCGCFRRRDCGKSTDGSGLIDIRDRPQSQTQTCRRNRVWCCLDHEPTYKPEPTYRPTSTYRPTHRPTHRPTPPPYVGGECGIRHLNGYAGNYGKGGYGQADFGEYPWIVALLNAQNHFLGTGALIDRWNVVTAAHKVYETNYQDIKVRAGEYDAALSQKPHGLEYEETYVEKMILHRQFNKSNLFNDVAVLQLSAPINEKRYINSICLPDSRADFTGKTCWVAGWGKDAFYGQYQTILKEVDLPILYQDKCEEDLRKTKLGYNFALNRRSFICAGGKANKDACTGDGGAPLVCEEYGKWYLAGLVAWGIDCANYNVPGVYVNIPNFVNFINRNSKSGGGGYGK